MKKTWVACAAGLLFVTGAANAISVSGESRATLHQHGRWHEHRLFRSGPDRQRLGAQRHRR